MFKELLAKLFHGSGDISGIKKTNSYYKNLVICDKWQKEWKQKQKGK